MKFLIIFTCVILATNALLEGEKWAVFKTNHNKIYKNIVEEKLRFQIFQNNLKTIDNHNSRYAAGLESWYMGINQFADMTTKEFSQILKRQQNSKPNVDGTIHEISAEAPGSIDWREKGAVLEVKDQGGCGSCWAFSATGALEGQNAIIYNRTVPLSEQQLLDCSTGYGNGDCIIGGDMILAFEYVIDNGIDSGIKYPYTAIQGNCQASGNHEVKVIGYKSIPQNEEALKNAVGVVGPISVAIYAEPIQFYSGGIFKSDDCTDDLDHGVLAVGYGTDPEPYWIVKNSWGAAWGEQGFFRIARNLGQCGIALDTSYPILFTRN